MILITTNPLLGKDYPYSSKSHTRGLELFAFSQTPVGIDIEKMDRPIKNYTALAERFFHPAEKVESREDFLKLWVKKEAYTKFLRQPLISTIGKKVPDDVTVQVFGEYYLGVAGTGELVINE